MIVLCNDTLIVKENYLMHRTHLLVFLFGSASHCRNSWCHSHKLQNKLSLSEIFSTLWTVPSSQILNLQYYRMNSKEHVEVNQQIDEMSTKGLIQES